MDPAGFGAGDGGGGPFPPGPGIPISLFAIAAPVIGGTSLLGGRGSIFSAFLGAVVIATIDNGLGLLGLSSGVKFVVTGLALLVAVVADSLSRRIRTAVGQREH